MFDPQALLDRLAPCMDAPAWRLGLSGGMDSMVLLHALSLLRDVTDLPPVTAIHVHHGLHADADRWAQKCVEACERADIKLHIVRVDVRPGASIENAARDARYQAFEAAVGTGEVLLLAHHQDDQVETLLFRLLRGTGLRGLSGMPRARALGRGELCRPLLGWKRADLHAWALQQRLMWIDDPANHDPRFARTTLRHEILPLLRRSWPMADGSLLRLAEHAGEAQALLDERAEEDLRNLELKSDDPWLACWPALRVSQLAALSAPRQVNLLRYWLHSNGCRAPDHRQLREIMDQLDARPDSQPVSTLDDYKLLRAAGCLWLLPLHLAEPQPEPIEPGSVVSLADNGLLRFERSPGGLAGTGQWEVRYRLGGEVLKPARRPTQTLKSLLQEAGIPVWLRERVPLLYCDGRLVSIGGRWHAEDACVGPGETGWQVRWEPEASD